MKKSIYTFIALMFTVSLSMAQTTAMPYTGTDCNGNAVDIFADLDAGKAVILHFYMPNCGACPPVAQKIQAMANKINATNPGKVVGYAFPYQNSTNCTYSSSWVSSNNLSALYTAMTGGAQGVAYYGGFGMPTVVLLGGTDHRIMFSTLSFSSADTTLMRDSINNLTTGIYELPKSVNSFTVFPNPAHANINIKVDLKENTDCMIDIADINGKQVEVITNSTQVGVLNTTFNTSKLANGNYLVRLSANGKTVTQKITVSH